jgi:hypothetical protein
MKEGRNLRDLEIRLDVTYSQAVLLARARREATNVSDPDVFLRAHIAALNTDIEKLRVEYCKIQRLMLEAGATIAPDQMDMRLTA